jgi:hypothetical protein
MPVPAPPRSTFRKDKNKKGFKHIEISMKPVLGAFWEFAFIASSRGLRLGGWIYRTTDGNNYQKILLTAWEVKGKIAFIY